MTLRFLFQTALLCLIALIGDGRSAVADVTPEQAQELRQLKRDLARVTGLLRKKEFDAAQTLLDEAEAKVEAVMTAAGVSENSRSLLGLPQLIATRRRALELQRQKAEGRPDREGVSFRSDVARVI